MTELFSERYKIRPKRQEREYVYNKVPFSVREGLMTIIKHFEHKSTTHSYRSLHEPWRKYLRILPETYSDYASRLEDIILNCEWNEFYDLCDVTYNFYRETHTLFSMVSGVRDTIADEFTLELNNLLDREGMGYQMREGKIERIGASFTDQEVAKARILLGDSAFEGPEEQFDKAIGFLNQRPDADPLNCIKEAVGAVEGIARILTGEHTDDLKKIIQKITANGMIPKPLNQTFEKVYAYRGNLPGVAHGQIEKANASIEEAEFTLGMCASMIIYLAKKYGIKVI